jgi:Bacteriophage HK97-gp10, putative tail-component
MASGFEMKLDGMNALLDKYRAMKPKLVKDLTNILNESRLNIETKAKQNAPRDVGSLALSINGDVEIQGENLVMYVGTPFRYGAYIEFGTGGKVDTRGYDEYASTFQGKTSGTMAEFIQALMKWVQRKGIVGTYSIKTQKRTGKKSIQQDENKKAAWLIAMSILRKGLRAHPWLFPAVESEMPNLNKNLNNYFNA